MSDNGEEMGMPTDADWKRLEAFEVRLSGVKDEFDRMQSRLERLQTRLSDAMKNDSSSFGRGTGAWDPNNAPRPFGR